MLPIFTRIKMIRQQKTHIGYRPHKCRHFYKCIVMLCYIIGLTGVGTLIFRLDQSYLVTREGMSLSSPSRIRGTSIREDTQSLHQVELLNFGFWSSESQDFSLKVLVTFSVFLLLTSSSCSHQLSSKCTFARFLNSRFCIFSLG